MKKILAIVAVFLLGGVARAGKFDEPAAGGSLSAGPVRVGGLLDVRYSHTSLLRGALRNSSAGGGTNKLRYGGRDTDGDAITDRDAHLFTIPTVSLLLDAAVLPSAHAHVHANAGADPEVPQKGLGIAEAYADVDQSWGRQAFRLRGGAFYPQISWEHPGPAWSPRYTLTRSAIGTWVAEDIRTLGFEGTWQVNLGRHWIRGSGGPVWGSDQTGWLLLQRGWAMHDYQADLSGGIPMPWPPPGEDATRPFQEIDGRPGHSWRADVGLLDNHVQIGGGYWGNHVSSSAVFAGSHFDAYRTWINHIGGKLEWGGATLLGQYLTGGTASLTFGSKPLAPKGDDRGLTAWYGLASYQWRKWRATYRYDQFQVEEWESGVASTGALSFDVGARQKITAEYIRVMSGPTLYRSRTKSADTNQTDAIFQLNHRFLF